MFQEFNTDTLGGRFIKSLLAQTPIPLFDAVVDGNHLVAGRYYVYKNVIIRCVSSGILAVSTSEELRPSNNLYPSVFLYVGTGYKAATFYVLSYVHEYNVKTHGTYKSSTNFYDSETHYYLGKYLRYLRTRTGTNLLPFYNVYNNTYFRDVELSATSDGKVAIERVTQQKHKVVAVPILFGHTYSIYIDSPTTVLMRACIHDDSGFIDEDTLPVEIDSNKLSLKQSLETSGKLLYCTRFKSPEEFRIETDSTAAMHLQHDLYLVIQLSLDNSSSIVVLEDYTDKTGIRCYEVEYEGRYNQNGEPLKDSVMKHDVRKLNPKLLFLNTQRIPAFSERLLEYLLGNVIHEHDVINNNIERVQNILCKLDDTYRRSFLTGRHIKGVWDNDMDRLIYSLLVTNKDAKMLFDQDNKINRDVERLLDTIGGEY